MIPVTSALRKIITGHNTEYVFLCEAGCGKEITRRQGYLKNNLTPGMCRSCANTKVWSQKLRPYEHTFNQILRQPHPVELTYEEFLEFTSITMCHYCGSLILWLPRKKYKKYTNSHHLDRKNNELGYTKNNCVVCCWECNRVKGSSYSYEEMLLIGPYLRSLRCNREGFVERGITFRIPRNSKKIGY